MSYCRWSCMGGQCDVYAYADVNGGVSVHIAQVRRVLTPDVPPSAFKDFCDGLISSVTYAEREHARGEALEKCEMRPIGLSRDGESFRMYFEDAAALVASLRAEGYLIPEGVEESIAADGKEEEGEG